MGRQLLGSPREEKIEACHLDDGQLLSARLANMAIFPVEMGSQGLSGPISMVDV